MTELVSKMKNVEIIGNTVSLKSAVNADKHKELENFAKSIVQTMKGE